MFSSNALVHLVFADPMDEYCLDGLLKLDLDRYLWLKLHERFSTVYFLRAADHGFAVETFGDKKANRYEPGQGFMKSWKGFFGGKNEIQRFGGWMLEQMKSMRSEAAAFVCSAEDFCKTAKGQDWEALLRQLAAEKDRTGILVLKMPLETERSRELLLNSPALGQLGDSAISCLRGDSMQEMFTALANNKKGACSFLSPCGEDGLHAILLRLQLENPQHLLTEQETQAAEQYLRRYLRDLRLQQKEPLFRSGEPALYLSFRDLYLQLKNERVWDELLARARKQMPQREDELLPAASLPLDRTGIAGRCAVKLFAEGLSVSDDDKRAKIAERILMNLLTPRSRAENKAVSEALEGFLQKLSSANPEDKETGQKILEAMSFCTDWLYVPEKSEEEQTVLALVERQNINLELSSLKYQTWSNYQNASSSGGDLLGFKLRQMKAQADSYRLTADQYQNLISTSMLDLSMSKFSSRDVFEKLSRLEESWRELQSQKEPEPPPDLQEETPQMEEFFSRKSQENESREEPEPTETNQTEQAEEESYDPDNIGRLTPEQVARLFDIN